MRVGEPLAAADGFDLMPSITGLALCRSARKVLMYRSSFIAERVVLRFPNKL